MKGVIIAGMRSGGGKTAITCMILSALHQRGIGVQPYKVGPDYIDPGYHQHACGTRSTSLDTWLLNESEVLHKINPCDDSNTVAVVEGVMGLFDGREPETDIGSTAEIARLTGWPVVLLVPAAKAGRSIIASIKGFIQEAAPVPIVGLILNQVGGSSHGDYLKQALQPLHIPILGTIPHLAEFVWPERHLGLQASQEFNLPPRSTLATIAEQYIDIDSFLTLTQDCKTPLTPPTITKQVLLTDKKIGVAQDESFHFYYPEDIEWLQNSGATLIPFSPLKDSALPTSVDAVVFGGGFPEVYASALSDNTTLRKNVHERLSNGLACYAECGGLMYLCEELRTAEGTTYPMVGLIPGRVEMTNRLQHFGYCIGKDQGLAIHGHEFHYSRWTEEGGVDSAWTVSRLRSGKERKEGWRKHNCHASYVHVSMSANPDWMKRRLVPHMR